MLVALRSDAILRNKQAWTAVVNPISSRSATSKTLRRQSIGIAAAGVRYYRCRRTRRGVRNANSARPLHNLAGCRVEKPASRWRSRPCGNNDHDAHEDSRVARALGQVREGRRAGRASKVNIRHRVRVKLDINQAPLRPLDFIGELLASFTYEILRISHAAFFSHIHFDFRLSNLAVR